MGRVFEDPEGATRHAETADAVFYLSKVIGFTLLFALSSKLQFHVPGSVVPATLQVIVVLAAGAILGPWGGVGAVTSYLMAGIAGAPVFAFGGGPAYLMGPTGGYLLGYLPAVYISGALSRRCDNLWSLTGCFSLACLVIHASGWAQLSALTGPEQAFRVGVLPFVGVDLLKAFLTASFIQGYRSKSLHRA
jgi:biotin transport system substrate-specific component